MARDITLRITADDSDAKAKLSSTDAKIAGLTENAQRVGSQFTGWGKALMPVSLAVGSIGLGIIAMAKRGSDVGDVTQQFTLLSAKAKETSQTMLGALRKGTLGAVSDLDLMKAANRAMGNGLQVNAQDMQVLASGAKLLSGALGGDTVAAFDVLANAITKNRVAGLQAIGLNVEHVKGAAVLGEVMAALTARTAESGAAQADFDDKLSGAGVRMTNAIDRVSVMASNSQGLADVVDILADGLGLLLTVVETLAGWFAKIPAPIQAAVVVLGGLLAAAGPVLFMVGQLVTAFGAIVPLFAAGTTGAGILAGAMTLLTGPVGLVVAAVVGLIAIWTTWGDDIARIVTDAYTAVKTWLWDKLEPVLTPIMGLLQSVGAMFSALGDLVGAVAGKVFGWVIDKIAGAFNVMAEIVKTVVGTVMGWVGKIPDGLLPLLGPIGAIVLAFRHWDEITKIAQAVYTGVKTWLLDKFTAIVDGVKAKVDAVTGFFKDMYMKVVGGSYVPDMIRGIAQEFAKLPAVMVKPVDDATQQVAEKFANLKASWENIGQTIVGALQGGGNVGKAVGAQIGGALGKDLGVLLAEKIKGTLGKALGSFAGPLGALAGSALGGVVGKMFSGNDTKKGREQFAAGMGYSSLGALYDDLRGMGEKGASLVHQGMNVIGKKDTAANQAWIESVKTLISTQQGAAASAKAMIPDWKTAGELADKYGISLEALGPKFKQGGLNASTEELYSDFQRLAAFIGEDMNDGVLRGMSDEISGLVRQALSFGGEIPKQMQPMIQKLQEMGLLVDENGLKLEGVENLKFGETMQETTKTLIDTMKELAKVIKDSVGGALADVAARAGQGIRIPITYDPPMSERPNTSYAAMGGYVTPRGVQYFDTGGWVRRGTDTVRAMLTPGEFVVSKRGVAALSALNEGRISGGSGPALSVTINNPSVRSKQDIRDLTTQVTHEMSRYLRRMGATP